MSFIPDCRAEGPYNEKNLNAKDAEIVRGYDWCAEMVVDCFFDNMDDYLDTFIMHYLKERVGEEEETDYEWECSFGSVARKEIRKVETYADLLRMKMNEWIERERDMLITSMIDAANNGED